MKAIFVKLVIVEFLLFAIPVSTVTAQSGKFQNLLEAAKKEAARGETFLVYASNPKQARTREALLEAFKKKYNLADFRFEWLSLFPSEAVTRIIAEARANKSGPSVSMGATSPVKRKGSDHLRRDSEPGLQHRHAEVRGGS